MDENRVVVGYDGSAQAGAAVEWAAAEAVARGARLSVVAAAEVLGEDISNAVTERAARAWTDSTALEGVELAHKVAPSLDAVAQALIGHPIAVLVRETAGSALLVMGSRGHGSFTGALLGSVAFAVTARAQCPVVVVRGEGSVAPRGGRRIVVGVDGSPASTVALDFASDTASSWGAPLTVLVAWHLSPVNSWAIAYGADRITDAERAAAALADQSVERARERHPDLLVRRVVEGAAPADALVRAADGAGLVVVGARGRGRLSGLLLGSVSHATIHGAPCPVAVVRADTDTDTRH